MTRRVVYYLLVPILLLACRQPQKNQTVTVNKFHGLPARLQGCACYFSTSEQDFRNDTYIIATDLDSLVFLSVNKNAIELRLVESKKDPHTFDDYENIYSDGIYKLYLKVNFKEHTGDEVWWNTGRMKLYFKEILIYEQSFIGECGC